MLKRFLGVFLCAAMVFALAGCANTTKSGSTQSQTEDENKVIKVGVLANWVDWVKEKAKAYEAVHKGTKVEVIELVNNSDLYSKTTMMMQSEQTAPDVITEDGFMVKADAAGGYLMPLTDVLAGWEESKQFAPTIMEGGKGVDGVQYALPLSTDVQGIWYNKQMFAEAGISVPFEPKSWNDILAAAKKLKAAVTTDGFVPLYLYASKTYPEETSMRTFQTLYFGTGEDAELYDMNAEKWVVDKEKLLDVFRFVDSVYNTEKVGPTPSFAAQSGIADLLQSDYMKNKKVGMYLSGSWESSNWAKGKSHEWADGLKVWGFAKIPTKDGETPGYTTMSGGWTWAIPSKANNKEGGIDFLKFVCNKDNQLEYALQTGSTQ